MSVGSVCQSNSQCSSQGCYVTEEDPSIRKCGEYSLDCKDPYQSVNVVQAPSVQCKLIPGQSCISDDHTLCVYKCVFSLETEKFRCSSNLPKCPSGQYSAYKTSSNIAKCYLTPNKPCQQNQGIECMYDCLQVLNTQEFQCSHKYVKCVAPKLPFIYNNSEICLLEAGYECKYGIECTSNSCYPQVLLIFHFLRYGSVIIYLY
ncbi:Hypothetical_protein [Hexamita inflata]|uniref:Hypothetical_protein n=1 Tax=Hexamita inflata TaxID=28002 RepID=A0AA86RHQ3_9EUKA|nr:Hypothetical protein HINF_LOCUS61328 [Hexamita inflata]